VIFIDTSALYAVLDRDDAAHDSASRVWSDWFFRPHLPRLVTGSYVLVETFALVQARLGMDAVRALNDDMLPALEVEWVTPAGHQGALQTLLAAGRRRLSLVGRVSFEIMRRRGIARAFTVDPHFAEVGFELIPQPAGASA
jgi:predicted nucleic acid-binding protein